MAAFDEIQKPTKTNVLICFCDLFRFLDIVRQMKDGLELFDVLNGMAVTIIRHINGTKGRVIKFIGDSALIAFPEESVDEGVLQLLELRERVIAYFKELSIDVKMHVGLHFGEVVVGPFGEEPNKSIDLFGDSVNKASMLAGKDYRAKFVITPQVFRKLKPETRKKFHKYTPPVVYFAE